MVMPSGMQRAHMQPYSASVFGHTASVHSAFVVSARAMPMWAKMTTSEVALAKKWYVQDGETPAGDCAETLTQQEHVDSLARPEEGSQASGAKGDVELHRG